MAVSAVIICAYLWPDKAAARACPDPVAPIQDLALSRFYKDPAGSKPDPARLSRNRKRTADLKLFLQNTADLADDTMRHGHKLGTASCKRRLLDNLLNWARAGALTGPMSTKQGEHHRKWAFTGLSLAYLKLKPALKKRESQAVTAWLKRLADDSAALFDDSGIKRNNHYYWLGLGTAALALATGDRHLWQRARKIYSTAIGHITPSGTLPMELARGSRALHYHGFALTALVPLHRLVAIRNPDVAISGASSLQRLIDLTSKGTIEPQLFERLSGKAQDVHPDPDRRAGYGWSHLLSGAVGLRRLRSTPRTPRAHRWLGGDARNLSRRLEALSRPAVPSITDAPRRSPARGSNSNERQSSERAPTLSPSPSKPYSQALPSINPAPPTPEPLSLAFWRDHFAPPSPSVVPPSSLVQLGERLFSDARLSGPGDMACATCHQPNRAFTDGMARRPDRDGNHLTNVPSIIGAGFARRLHWDGAFTDLKTQAEHAITARNEMAGDWAAVLARLNGDDALRAAHRTAFGASPKTRIEANDVLDALAAFIIAKIPPYDTPFDRFIAGDETALTPRARAGFDLFVGKAGCVVCHGTWRLTNDAMHPSRPVRPGPETPPYVKTPGLRLVSRTAPYMHDGGHPTLEAVVESYVSAPRAHAPRGATTLHPRIPQPLTADEKTALIAFLNSL